MTDVMGEIRSLMSEPVLNTPLVRAMVGKLQREGNVEMLAYLAEALALRETPVEPLVLRPPSNEDWAYAPDYIHDTIERLRKETGRPVVLLASDVALEYPGGRSAEEARTGRTFEFTMQQTPEQVESFRHAIAGAEFTAPMYLTQVSDAVPLWQAMPLWQAAPGPFPDAIDGTGRSEEE